MSDENGVKVDKLVKVYIKIRDARAALARKYEDEDGRLEEQQETIKRALLEVCKDVGVDSLKTQFGTASRTVKTRYSTTNWEAFIDFCKENDTFGLIERRIGQLNMKDFLAENPEVRIPGLNADSYYDISVRRSK